MMTNGDHRFASFILTFDRPAKLAQTIEAVLGQTLVPELLLIVDNGTNVETQAVVERLADPRVVYEPTGANLGSAGGVAFGMERLFTRGYQWIHSIDDDDPPQTPDTIERLQRLIHRNDDGKLGAVAAVGSRWDWKVGEYSRLSDTELGGDLEVDVVGGGHQLTVRREVIAAIGPPNKEFFFGHYDPFYCLQIADAGFRVMIDGDLMREYRQRAGRMNVVIRPSLVPRHGYDSIWRRYYVTRNYIFAMTKLFQQPRLARREARKALLRSVASWKRGPRYAMRFNHLQLRAVVDGYRGRLGRTVAPRAQSIKAG
jgi:glycosyltransferase involved in cell wall biosynthesis